MCNRRDGRDEGKAGHARENHVHGRQKVHGTGDRAARRHVAARQRTRRAAQALPRSPGAYRVAQPFVSHAVLRRLRRGQWKS